MQPDERSAASGCVSDPIATIRDALDWQTNTTEGRERRSAALAALDSLAAALAQAERDRDLYGRALARIGELNPALLAGEGDGE